MPEPTKESLELSLKVVNKWATECGFDLDLLKSLTYSIALAIDPILAENAKLNAIMKVPDFQRNGLLAVGESLNAKDAENVQLREQLRLAVEARKAWELVARKYSEGSDDADRLDTALRVFGVDI